MTVEGIEYVNARHLVAGSDPEYASDVRWMTVETDARKATVRCYDVGAETDGIITTATW